MHLRGAFLLPKIGGIVSETKQAALVEHISLCHQRARVARQKIDESSTIEELNQVKF